MLLTWWAQAPAAEVVLPWPVVAGGVAAIMTILAGLVTGGVKGYLLVRRWVRQQAQVSHDLTRTARGLAQELATSNGHTIGEYTEDNNRKLRRITDEVTVLTEWAGQNRDLAQQALARSGENRDLAQRALALAQQAVATATRADNRIDQHLVTGHGGQ